MSDDRNQAITPNTNFAVLNTSDQGISENILIRTQKSKSKILKTIYSRDLIRKKTVGCRIYTNEIVDTIQSELKKNCRICIQDEESSQFISPCKCKGSAEFVHEECLKMWTLEQFGVNKIYNKNLICEICKHKLDYRVNFVDRFDICQFKNIKLTIKLCWIIQLVFIALCVYASILIVSRFGIDSLSTISIVVVICLILLAITVNLCFSVIQAHKIEMIENWQFQNYKPSNGTLHSKRQLPNTLSLSIDSFDILVRNIQYQINYQFMSKQQWTLLTTDTQKLQLFGMQARLTTNYGDVFQGLIYYCDEQIIILKNEDDFFLINQQSIQDLQTIDIQDPKQTLQNLLAIDLAAMAQEMIKKEMKEPHQQLFDHLQKLYRDVDWKDQEIIIPSISIRISPPYKSDNISGENKLGVERLRKIVKYIVMNFLCRLINMPKFFEYSQTLYRQIQYFYIAILQYLFL